MKSPRFGQLLAGLAVAALLCVLGFFSTMHAAPTGGKPPFDDAVAQRAAMIQELRAIKELLQEQNKLLQAALPKTDGREKSKP